MGAQFWTCPIVVQHRHTHTLFVEFGSRFHSKCFVLMWPFFLPIVTRFVSVFFVSFFSFISILNMFPRVVHSFKFPYWVRGIDIYGKLQSCIFIFRSEWRSEDGRAYAVHSTHVEIFRVKSWHNCFVAILSFVQLLWFGGNKTDGAHLTPIPVLVCVFNVFYWQRKISTVYWECASTSIHPNARNRIDSFPFKVSVIHKFLGMKTIPPIQVLAHHSHFIHQRSLESHRIAHKCEMCHYSFWRMNSIFRARHASSSSVWWVQLNRGNSLNNSLIYILCLSYFRVSLSTTTVLYVLRDTSHLHKVYHILLCCTRKMKWIRDCVFMVHAMHERPRDALAHGYALALAQNWTRYIF